jgi:hypothetical protein
MGRTDVTKTGAEIKVGVSRATVQPAAPPGLSGSPAAKSPVVTVNPSARVSRPPLSDW